MPTYNSSRFVAESIEAIIAQTYKNWELLITDDCSTDNTVEVIDKYTQDKRIRLFQMKKNGGPGASRNHSIENAIGRFIAFCDSDDVWMTNKLEKQLAFMEEMDCALSYGSYILIGEDGKTKGLGICKKKQSYFSMLCDNGIGCLTGMYDTKEVGKIYMPLIRKRQDWGLWLTIIRKCKVAYGMKEPLALYRIRRGSISHNKLELIKHNINIYKKVLGYSSIKAYFMFLCMFLPTYLGKKALQKYVNR